jgi:hypothetical protein
MLSPDKVREILGGELSRKEVYELPITKTKLSAKRVLYAPSDVKAYLTGLRGQQMDFQSFLFAHFLNRPPFSARATGRALHAHPDALLKEFPEMGPFPWDARAVLVLLSASREILG